MRVFTDYFISIYPLGKLRREKRPGATGRRKGSQGMDR